MDERLEQHLHLAKRAHALVTGKAIEIKAKVGKIYYLFIATDASEKTKSNAISLAKCYNIDYQIIGVKALFSSIVQYDHVALLGLTKPSFLHLFNRSKEDI
jgi:hypothetical protein